MTSFAHNRYRTDIAEIFSEENKLNLQLLIEKEIAYANYLVNKIPKKAYEEIELYCSPEHVRLKRVKEIEQETNHDLMAVVLAISEQCPTAGGYVHLGATSNDIQDTVLGLQLKQSKRILLKNLQNLKKKLIDFIEKNRDVICVGRTHGQHAIPITYGFKFSNFLLEVELTYQQLQNTIVEYGKISGAVGTYASYGTQEIEKIVLNNLDLKSLPITTQVIPRIIHSQFIFSLSIISATLERISKEIRNLSRTEIREVFEFFGEKQVGSSTMPQKRNPTISERICGIAKYLRNSISIELENIPLEHERDLTNSSSERLLIPQTVNLVDYIIIQMTKVISGLQLDKKQIEKNLNLTKGRICAEKVMLSLGDKIGRQKAHRLLNDISEGEEDFLQTILGSSISKYLTEDQIKELLDPANYIGFSREITEQILTKFRIPSSYAEAGVDITSEYLDIEEIGKWVKKSFQFQPTGLKFGHYANTISLGDWELGLSTDGVGSKLLIAEMMNKFNTIGIDCVAMNVNDLLSTGLKPIAFVDYLAINGPLGREKSSQIAQGLYEGCKIAKIPILGGELATLPELVKGFDLAGTALGITKKGEIVDGSLISPEDIVIGISSNGLHSNGYTLARKVLLKHYGLKDILPNSISLGDELLRPTFLYCDEIERLLKDYEVRGIAHITGGGFRKLMRITRFGFEINNFPDLQTIFKEIKEKGNISWQEMFSTFNMGIGMIIVVNKKDANSVLNVLRDFKDSWILGKIISEHKIKITDYHCELA